ncbi:DHH family phosphoesterase [Lentilactobacillus farraginis]|uniref:3'-to-5' oligoribonuclease A n=1 Tax=Lentilactobacillus farraginis DSM 18382 = JCM 14108 TaxID=1423743 RepID=X0P968_9LACO|nr:bifunctional oligoribonuclease/PAP phosphatase NrnA [Lentilactobacillus farraginis]KRM10052.1 phosphoesterase [Lentilactobacillus farraginis DSM 18382 = JCM 14108]GAF35203.1 3'-to-5' oligoribonuclease A [Lentilactobacillus farraginis DSM 18382 = JCM 14108]
MSIQKQILDQIKQAKTVIIHRHKRPDPDAIGSQMGLAEIIKASFPDKRVFCAGKNFPGFKWLGTADEIPDDQYKDALVIVVDTANQPRVDDARYTKGKTLVKIDHHPNDDQFGDLMWVIPEASSTSELIFDFYDMFRSELTLSDEGARLLYAGIVGDTGRFMYPSTSSHTFEVASKLTKYHFSASDVNQAEDEIDMPLARLSAYAYENLKMLPSGAAYLVLSNEILKPFGLGDESTSSIVPLPGRIKEVISWAIFVQQKEGDYRIRLRSKGPAINELAKAYGGGGHPLASGAVIESDDQIKDFVRDLDNLVKKNK